MQTAAILAKNPNAKVYTISSAAHQGTTELLRALRTAIDETQQKLAEENEESAYDTSEKEVPTIALSSEAYADTWEVERTEDGKFIVTGAKIEKFARRTDLNNYASLNRLRDIMKKMGIKAELTSLGAEPESIISIAGKEFTLVEDY